MIEKLKEGWLPEQISGNLSDNNSLGKNLKISHKSIYHYLTYHLALDKTVSFQRGQITLIGKLQLKYFIKK